VQCKYISKEVRALLSIYPLVQIYTYTIRITINQYCFTLIAYSNIDVMHHSGKKRGASDNDGQRRRRRRKTMKANKESYLKVREFNDKYFGEERKNVNQKQKQTTLKERHRRHYLIPFLILSK
jgi:hypothetical protein